MLVYVIRHGQSETNVQGKWTGWLDVKLTDRGRADALNTRRYLDGVTFDKIYSSDLVRARETAELALPGCEYEVTELLREVNVGRLANVRIDSITDEERAYLANGEYDRFGGESREEFSARVGEIMSGLESSGCKKVALFSHAGWLRAMLNRVLEMRTPRAKILCNNCAIAIFQFDSEGWHLHSWINHT